MHIDRKRSPEIKARTLSRRAQRRLKSATLFLALAFSAGDDFAPNAR